MNIDMSREILEYLLNILMEFRASRICIGNRIQMMANKVQNTMTYYCVEIKKNKLFA